MFIICLLLVIIIIIICKLIIDNYKIKKDYERLIKAANELYKCLDTCNYAIGIHNKTLDTVKKTLKVLLLTEHE